MCDLIEEYAKEEAAQKAKEIQKESARNLFKNGVDFETIEKSMLNLTKEELLDIYEEVEKNK